MTYRVVITERAKQDLKGYYLFTEEKAPITAAKWFNRFQEALEKLSQNPGLCMLAPENDLVAVEIRQLLFGKRLNVFRALFTILNDEVQVLHIRRASMEIASHADFLE